MIPLFFGLLLVSYASCEAWKYFKREPGNPFGASQKLPLCDAKAKRTTTADRANSISANVGRGR